MLTFCHLAQNVPCHPLTLGHGSHGSNHFWRQKEADGVFLFQTVKDSSLTLYFSWEQLLPGQVWLG